MTGTELRNSMVQSVAKSLQEVSAARDGTETAVKYVELTGRLDILRTLLTYLQSVVVEECPPAAVAKQAVKRTK